LIVSLSGISCPPVFILTRLIVVNYESIIR
jgi:hypothetical protein